MKVVPLLVSAIITVGLIIVLSRSWGPVPPIGKFLSPQEGFWQNAEPVNEEFSMDIAFPQLQDKASVYFDDRLVPHVFAQNDHDLYFVQGYLHARFRLWQMEFQLMAAGGRISEVLGAGSRGEYLAYDRNMRRMGMQYGAQQSLAVMESDPKTKMVLDAYTEGVNSYIDNLTKQQLPLEFRILDYQPERWSNFKTALFLMNMRYSLSGYSDDIEYSNIKNAFTHADFNRLFPLKHDSTVPVIPRDIDMLPPVKASVHPSIPAGADSAYFAFIDSSAGFDPLSKPDEDNGSNNWAVNGSKTASGSPILCNDPHLDLNLPSLWYEIQLHGPDHNVYGVSFPGAPCVVIGFNDNCSWGVTNSERDVFDYYSIRFRDDSKKEYWFENEWTPTQLHIDTFFIKDAPFVTDTIAYTWFGPVQYDGAFAVSRVAAESKTNLALRWKGLDGGNEIKTFYQLNRCNSYTDYLDALKHFTCPGQNFVFASKSDEIALWQQGQFPAKWKEQGRFIMPGNDSSYRWQGYIPQEENPFALNPVRGYISSANQLPADTTYPYYLGGNYDVYRGYTIDRELHRMQQITPADMQALQSNNYNSMAEIFLPVMLRNVDMTALSDSEENYLEIVSNWNYKNDAKEKGPAIFHTWFDSLLYKVYTDEFANIVAPYRLPHAATMIDALIKDPAYRFIDDINTPGTETLQEVVTAAFKSSIKLLEQAEENGRLEWGKFKDSGIRNLLRIESFSRFHLDVGGGNHIVNAIKKYHGPSWRMVVHLTKDTEAYGIYPGGQSGNPGSYYYDNYVDDWAAGKYNSLWVMRDKDNKDSLVKHTINFTKGF